jgi:hypothetical protein
MERREWGAREGKERRGKEMNKGWKGRKRERKWQISLRKGTREREIQREGERGAHIKINKAEGENERERERGRERERERERDNIMQSSILVMLNS